MDPNSSPSTIDNQSRLAVKKTTRRVGCHRPSVSLETYKPISLDSFPRDASQLPRREVLGSFGDARSSANNRFSCCDGRTETTVTPSPSPQEIDSDIVIALSSLTLCNSFAHSDSHPLVKSLSFLRSHPTFLFSRLLFSSALCVCDPVFDSFPAVTPGSGSALPANRAEVSS